MAADDRIPAGSRPVDEIDMDASPPQPTEPEFSAPELPGKFQGKAPEDILESYAALEKKFGGMGDELGKLREINASLLSALQNGSSAAQPAAVPAQSQPELADIIASMERGEMDIPDAIGQVAQIIEGRTSALTAQQFQQYEEKRRAQEIYQSFLQKNPDYEEVLQSGALAPLKRANPMHDDFSAFLEYRADKRVREAYEKGREETSKIAAGADATKKTLGQDGTSVRDVNAPKKPLNRQEKINTMLEAMKKARAS
jgi:hypothetical protein